MSGSDKPNPELVKGWCPGARRPMETGDGLLVRLRITAGIVSADLAGEIADLSRRFGNELIDLSQRGNLQLRGVEEDDLYELLGRLDRLGILDPSAEAEAVRNIVPSPLAGLDPSAAIDGRALASALEARLTSDPSIFALPGKFGFVVDEGGRLALDDVAVDVRLTGLATPDGPRVLLAVAVKPGHYQPIAVVGVDEAPERAADLARAVVKLRAEIPEAPRRMHEIVGLTGLAALFHAAGFGEVMAEVERLVPRRAGGTAILGDHTHEPGGFIGLGAPFGRFTADQLALIGELAGERGGGEIRLTPWRAVLIPGVNPEKLPRIRPWIAAGRFVFSPDDPRLAVVTCAGSTGCRNATLDTREHAAELASIARRLGSSGTTLHVSGCEKGCAHPGAMPYTLTARDGRYDLVRAGRAWDAPAITGLSLVEAAAALADFAPL